MGVQIRYRKNKEGYSIYLDVYHKGKRTYEYPQLTVSKDYSQLNNISQADKDQIELVRKLRHKISLDLTEGKYGFAPSNKRKADFIVFYEKIASEKGHKSYDAVLRLLRLFANKSSFGRLPISQFNEKKVTEFLDFLKTDIPIPSKNNPLKTKKLSENTCFHYLDILNVGFNRAVKERIITENPIKFLAKEQKPKRQHMQRVYLTIEELQILKNTPLSREHIKKAFLFGCYTGLRISDLKKLKHSEIMDEKIHFRQKKSKVKFLEIDLNDTAKAILSSLPPHPNSELVFWDLPNANTHSLQRLKKWGVEAGLIKAVKWHTARHTFAVNFLSHGNHEDVYALKEILGHSSVRETEIYAQIAGVKKKKLINNIPSLY